MQQNITFITSLFEGLFKSFYLGYLSHGKKQFIIWLVDMETVLPEAYTRPLFLGCLLSWYFWNISIFSLIRNRMKNESYLTQWLTKYFLNITLVSFYSKSVSRQDFKCLHFASVQMKNIVQNRPFFKRNEKNESYLTQWHTNDFHNINLVFICSSSVSRQNSKCLHFASVQMKNIVQNRPVYLSF